MQGVDSQSSAAIDEMVATCIAQRERRRDKLMNRGRSRWQRFAWGVRRRWRMLRRASARTGSKREVVCTIRLGDMPSPTRLRRRRAFGVCFADDPDRVPANWVPMPIEYWGASDALTTAWARSHAAHLIRRWKDIDGDRFGSVDIVSWRDPVTLVTTEVGRMQAESKDANRGFRATASPMRRSADWWDVNGQDTNDQAAGSTTGSLRWIGNQAVESPELTDSRRPRCSVVIPVHNAHEHVKRCLDSVIPTLCDGDELIVVDDGSDAETAELCRAITQRSSTTLIRHDVIRHDHPCGFPGAANAGISVSTCDFVIVLNSDTMVSIDWIDRLLHPMVIDDHVAAVGPLSNNAQFQSVPFLIDDDPGVNEVPDGFDLLALNRFLARWSVGVVPVRVPLLNGFCIAMRRSVIDEIGGFDAAGFGRGFGEENDWCLRAVQAGHDLVIATDVYIHHAKGASYRSQEVVALKQQATKTLLQRFGRIRLDHDLTSMRSHAVLSAIRADTQYLWEQLASGLDGRSSTSLR